MTEYRYKWKYEDTERPYASCYDCGIPYKEMEDMVIDNDDWETINPTYHKGAGILCPTCMVNRLEFVGLWYEKYFKRLLNK